MVFRHRGYLVTRLKSKIYLVSYDYCKIYFLCENKPEISKSIVENVDTFVFRLSVYKVCLLYMPVIHCDVFYTLSS